MRMALVDESGLVRNVVLLDTEMWDAPSGLSARECEDAVGPGWRWAEGTGFLFGDLEDDAR